MKLLDVVALTEDLPEKGLRREQVGTTVSYLRPTFSRLSLPTSKGGPTRRSASQNLD